MTIKFALRCSLFAALLFPGPAAAAADINGAWANKAASCSKVFTKRNNKISFAKNADAYGNGFILEGNQIRGRLATCNIKHRKEDGPVLHLISVCATSVAFETVQLTVKIIDDKRIVQIFPGVPEIEVGYERCLL